MSANVRKIKREVISESEESADSSDRDARIAEIAYCKAEKRGFEPGHELEDWFEAEQELGL